MIKQSMADREPVQPPERTPASRARSTRRRRPPATAAAGQADISLLASIVDSTDDAVFSKTLDGVITSWNHAAESMYGYPAEEIIGQSIAVLMPDGSEEMVEILSRIRQGQRVEHFQTTRSRKDGTTVPISLTVSPIYDGDGRVIGASSIAKDITRARTTEAEIALLANIVDSSDDAIVSKTLDGVITSWNHAAEKMYGWPASQIVGKSIMEVIPKGSTEMVDILGKIRTGIRVDHYQTTRIRQDGSAVPISLTVSPIYDRDGAIVGASSIARDITELIRADAMLRAASEYARSLIEASLDPLVTISPEGKITDVNEATTKVTGLEREKLIGTDFSDYFTEPEEAREGYQRVFAEGAVTDYPLTIRHQDGKLTDVLYNASVYNDAADHVLGVFAAARDVTAQRRAEAEIADQRAKDLERLAELERFQRLTVGRELKMIELKKEITELRRRLPADVSEET